MSSRLSLMGYLQPTSYPEMLVSLASCLILIYFLQYWCFRRRSSSGTLIPTNWPLVGMIPSIFINRHDLSSYVAAVLKEAGGNLLFKGPWFAGMDTFATCDPANIKHILISNFPNYPKGPRYLEAFDAFGDGFINSDGDLWAFHRRVGLALMSSPRFWSNIRAVSLKKIAADHDGLLAILDRVADESSAVDLCDVFSRIFVDLAFITVVGVDPGCLAPHLPDMALARAMQDIERVGFCRLVRPRLWWNLKRRFGLWEEKRLPQARKLLDDYLARCIGKRRVEIGGGGGGGGAEDAVDLLGFYTEMINRRQAADGRAASDKFLRDSLLNFITANKDGASVLLGWFFWLVSTNPRAEKKIVEELRLSKLSPNRSTSVFSADEAEELVYLHAAISESLRLYPPVPYSGKLALNADVLPSGDKVNAGQYVFISVYGIARMEGVWGDDCLEFRPERWIDEGSGELRHEPSHKFVTFNCGPRSCVGKNMAMEWMKMVAAAVMYNFEVEVEEGQVAEPSTPSLLLQMKNGLRVRLKNRIWTS